MAELLYNDLLSQLSAQEQDQFQGVFGSKGWLGNYQDNPNAPMVTGHSSYAKFKPIADAAAQSKTLNNSFWSNLNPFGTAADAAMPTDAERAAIDTSGIMGSYRPNMRDISGEVGEYDNTSGFNLNNMDLNNPDAAIGPIINFKDAPVELNETLKGLRRNNPRYGLIDQFRNQGGDETTGFNLPNFGLTGILQGLKDQFKYRGATEEAWDPNTGEFISAEEQDKQNALGGYYSDAARNQRRQRARVVDMIARRDAGKSFSEKNLARLQELGYGPEEIISQVTDVVRPGTGTTYTGPETTSFDPGIAARTQHPTERAGTRGGYTDPGRGSYGPWKAEGGRIGYANGEFVDEDVNIAGPGFDVNENVMMASDENNTRLLENLFEKYLELGFSPKEAEKMAMDEFELMSQGPEQEQGIASLV